MKSPAAKRKAVSELVPSESETSDIEELSSHDEDFEFTLERIRAEQVIDGVKKYLVKWQGYDDDRSTWEPAKSFADKSILKEWRQQRDSGDTLSQEEILELEARMGAYMVRREAIKAKRTRKQSLKKRQNPQIHEQARLKTQERQEPPKRKARSTSPKVQTKPTTPVLAQQRREITTTISSREPQRFHAIASTKNKKRRNSGLEEVDNPHSAQATSKSIKNWKHLNNLQKKRREEIVPSSHLTMTPLSELAKTTTNNPAQSQPSRETASSIERAESYLFFPDANSDSPELRDSLPSTRDDPLLLTTESLSLSKALSEERHSPAETRATATFVAPYHSESQQLQTTSGRLVDKSEILVRLGFGDHEVGDVLITQFPHWLKAILVNLKDGHLLKLHFEHSLVVTASQFVDVTTSWPSDTVAIGGIKPFDDTLSSATSLSQHLKRYESAAIWEHPDPTNTIGFVLYCPDSDSWRRHADAPKTKGCPLLLEARNRAQRNQRPVPVLRKLDAAETGPQISQTLPASLEPPNQSLPQPNLDADVALQVTVPEESTNTKQRIPTRDPRQRRESRTETITSGPDVSLEGGAMDLDETVVKHDMSNRAWTVTEDFHALTTSASASLGKPTSVYIAFTEQHPQQGEAMKKWAAKHTSLRFIYLDKDGQGDWNLFRSSNNTALLLFHKDCPSFCMLKDFHHLLARDNTSHYNVSWDDRGEYTFTRLLLRSTVFLVTEYSIIMFPQDTILALKWLKQDLKKKSTTKLMVRPNIRAWLQHTALAQEDDQKKEQLFDILVLLLDLSSVADVTIGGDIERLEFLTIGTSDHPDMLNTIVPLPTLANYDSSPSAPTDKKAISSRDDVLVNHFIYWSVTNATNYRRFFALDDLQARKDVEKGWKPEGSEHIKFYRPDAFMKKFNRNEIEEGKA